MKNRMIFEFIGLPGSGKTTISRELIKELKSDGYNVISGYYTNSSRLIRFLKKLISITIFFIRFPVKSIYVIRICFKSHNYSFASYKDIAEILFLLNRYDVAKKSNKIWIFDQGLYQAAISLQLFADKNTEIFKYLSNNIEKVIYVKSEILLAKNRLNLRNDFSSRIQKNGVNIDEMRLAEKIITEKVTDTLNIKKDIFTVQNNEDLIKPVLKTKEWIKVKIKK